MANFSITITRASPAGSVSRNKTFSDNDLDRLQAAVIAELNEQEIPNPTQNQIADYIFARIVADLKVFTRNRESQQAAAAVTNIGL